MTDLFDSLANRFAPDAPIAIRPRPQARFEAGHDAGGIVEEDGFDVVRAPNAPETVAAARDNTTPAAPAPNMIPVTKPHAIGTPKEAATKDGEASATATPPKQADVTAQEQVADTHEMQIGKPVDPAPDREIRPKVPNPAGNVPDAPLPESETIREIHRATTVNPATPLTPIRTRVAPAQDKQPAPAPTPAPQEPSTVVRIGRVEMRQATPPPPPPKPAAPQRAANNTASAGRSSGHTGSSSRGSGLTDYLGWKRK